MDLTNSAGALEVLCHYCHEVIGKLDQFRTWEDMPKGTCAFLKPGAFSGYDFAHHKCHRDMVMLREIASAGAER